MGLIDIAVGAIGSIIGAVAVAEFDGWAPSLTARLLSIAVTRLPVQHRERFSEEWQSHLIEIPTKLSRIIVAVGFLIAAERVRTPVRIRFKYATDKLLTVSFFVAVLPQYALFAAAVKIMFRGSILVPMRAVGEFGKPITAMRFRTSHEEGHSSRLSLAFGSFLRITCLDHMPVVYSVINGDLTLFGSVPAWDTPEGVLYAGAAIDRARPGAFPEAIFQRLFAADDGEFDEAAYAKYLRDWTPWLEAKLIARVLQMIFSLD